MDNARGSLPVSVLPLSEQPDAVSLRPCRYGIIGDHHHHRRSSHPVQTAFSIPQYHTNLAVSDHYDILHSFTAFGRFCSTFLLQHSLRVVTNLLSDALSTLPSIPDCFCIGTFKWPLSFFFHNNTRYDFPAFASTQKKRTAQAVSYLILRHGVWEAIHQSALGKTGIPIYRCDARFTIAIAERRKGPCKAGTQNAAFIRSRH